MARAVPFPGSASPIASVRQFIEFAVNIPEHDPQVGQAVSSMEASSASDTDGSADATIESIRSSLRTPDAAPETVATTFPASIGPPETNTVGMLAASRRSACPA